MKGICVDTTPILGISAGYHEKRSHDRFTLGLLPSNTFNITCEDRCSIKCLIPFRVCRRWIADVKKKHQNHPRIQQVF